MATILKELLSKDQASLRKQYQDLAHELMGLRFQHQAKQLKNTQSLSKVRREKARVKTALSMLQKKGQK
ncbi:MAG: 50S ribosomal protein L29 [Holosporaceae bacterium]